MRLRAPLVVLLVTSTGLFAQEPAATPAAPQEPAAAPAAQEKGQPEGWRKADQSKPGEFVVTPGTKVPLALINSVSTKHSAEGDRVYLETVFPIMVNGRIVIPPGSYVAGTVTQVKRPGRVTCHNSIRCHVFGYDTSRADNRVLTNGDPA